MVVTAALLVATPAVAQEEASIPTAEEILQQASAGQLNVGQTRTSILPQVFVEDIDVTADTAGLLSGTFVARNTEQGLVGDLGYDILILGPRPEAPVGSVVADNALVYDRTAGQETFSIAGQTSRKVPFTYQAPALPEGEYRVRMQLRTANGRELGWDDEQVTLRGAATFAAIQPDAITVESTDPITGEVRSSWHPLAGPNVSSSQEILFNATVRNIGSGDLTGTVRSSVQRLYASGQSPVTAVGPALTLAAGQSQAIAVPLTPGTAAPGAYTVTLSVYDGNERRVSNLAEFRYVVSGPSASVVRHVVTSLAANAGGTTEVDFAVAGPADRSTQVSGTVEIALLDEHGVAASTISSIDFNDSAAAVGVARLLLDRDLGENARVQVTLRSDAGAVLDQYEISLADAPLGRPDPISTAIGSPGLLMRLVAIIVTGLVALWLTLYLLRLNRRPGTPLSSPPAMTQPAAASLMLALAATGSVLLLTALTADIPRAQANGIQWVSIQGSGPHYAVDLWVNSPNHNSNHNPGIVAYEARLQWVVCGNIVSDGALYVYLPVSGGHIENPNGQNWALQAQSAKSFGATYQINNFTTHSLHLTANLDLTNSPPATTVWSHARAHRRNLITAAEDWVTINDMTWVNVGGPTSQPTECVAYMVHDEGTNDSQFFTVDTVKDTYQLLGFMHKDMDIEGLDLDPTSGKLYGSSGANGKKPGHLYEIDKKTGQLTEIGATGFGKMAALSFTRDGTLWGWVIGRGGGLARINISTGRAQVVLPSSKEMGGLAWNSDDSVLYATEKDVDLYTVNVSTGAITKIASNLPGPTEALETRPDNPRLLMGAFHGASSSISIFGYDVVARAVVSSSNIATPFNDIEGIAWPAECGDPEDPTEPPGDDNLTAVIATQEACLNANVTADGSGSSSVSGPLTYAWSVTDPNGQPVVLSDATAAQISFPGLVEGTYSLSLTITDSRGASDTATTSITVFNNPPVANVAAAAGQVNVLLPLDGSGSFDPDSASCGDSIVSFAWQVTDPNGQGVVLSSTTDDTTTFTPTRPGPHSVQLTVTDSLGKTGTTQVTVAVNPPPFDPGDIQETE